MKNKNPFKKEFWVELFTTKKEIAELKRKRLEMLNGTIEHYTIYNRGYIEPISGSGGKCTYQPTDNSQGCAIGRHIENKEICRQLDEFGYIMDDRAFKLLPENLKELGQSFLANIQGLHDSKFNWDENGLTEKGLSHVAKIKTTFELR